MKENNLARLMMKEEPTCWDTDALSAQGFFGLGFLTGLLIFFLMLLICTLAYFITRWVFNHQNYMYSKTNYYSLR